MCGGARTGDRAGQGPRRSVRFLLPGLTAALMPAPAFALDVEGMLRRIATHESAGAIVMGISIFALTTAFFYVRERNAWQAQEIELNRQLRVAQGRADMAEVVIGAEQQVIVVWAGVDAQPHVEGSLSIVPGSTASVLAFGTWLPSAEAQRMEEATELLKRRGEAFRMTLRASSSRHIDAEGQAVGGRVVLRLRDATGTRRELLQAIGERDDAQNAVAGLRAALERGNHPAWTRGADGRIDWINGAYARAVEATDAEGVIARQTELLGRGDRDAMAEARMRGRDFAGRVPAIVAGSRRMLAVHELRQGGGWVGLATDVTEIEDGRAELEREKASHTRTLDSLQTAVAIFDGEQRLAFHNAAYRTLWSLDEAFLATRPTDGEILDWMRAARLVPEQADFRGWKAELLAAYRSVETVEDWWCLPDSRMLRVVVSPNERGGVTYLYEDMTERVHLESRFNSLNRVQRETLDALQEGVAVFGTDGRLKLVNRAFAELWRLPLGLTERPAGPDMPHVDDVAVLCRDVVLGDGDSGWSQIRDAVVGLHDSRTGRSVRIACRDGRIVDGIVAPLPDGATLVTFTDMTASVNVERALLERNEALQRASRLRDDFVHHVSYELRSPLTTIIGFAQLLGDETVGPLNERQRDYTGHITQSSAALLAIINDILDLATIDNGDIELTCGPVDIRDTIAAAVRGVEDRLNETSLTLLVDTGKSVGTFNADGKRVRQVLFNLLSNAIGFSSPGQTVRVKARRGNGEVALTVTDEGRGIPEDVRRRVFERFESHTSGSRHRGAGLGLSIVKSLVELHGGRVVLDSAPGKGTSVTCIFPDGDEPVRSAAE